MAENQTTSEAPKKKARKPRACEPEITVVYGTKPMSDYNYQRICDAMVKLYKAQFPPVVGECVRKIVAARSVEHRAGFVANELSVALSSGVEVSVERRGHGIEIPIVRHNGEVVAHGWPPDPIFKPEREWLGAISVALEEIWQDEMRALALPGCARCNSSGSYPGKDDLIACECTLHKVSELNEKEGDYDFS